MNIPQELLDYLVTLISTPDLEAIYVDDISTWVVGEKPDNSCPGLIACGQLSKEQAVDLDRVLMPGAHLLLIASESEPTGHTGACIIEDAGFEIRDSILWVKEAGHFHYVPKASRSERNAGCSAIKPQKMDLARKKGDPGGNNPRNRGAEEIKNYHPTIKPIKIMEKLLQDIPIDDGHVLDPFMGSGTTGIACIKTGHDFIGVEKESDYIKISNARVKYWDSEQGYVTRKIESDVNNDTQETKVIDFWGNDY